NIAMDHTEYLGETLREIAFHKAGIIKNHAPVIIGSVGDDALQVIKNEALKNEVDYYILGENFLIYNQFPVDLTMKGEHQYRNSSLALKALELLIEAGYKMNWDQALYGIADTKVPGRYELIHRAPVIIVDAAHNPDGIRSLIATANQEFPNKEKHIIV